MEKFYDIYFNFLGEGVSDEQTDGSPVKYMQYACTFSFLKYFLDYRSSW